MITNQLGRELCVSESESDFGGHLDLRNINSFVWWRRYLTERWVSDTYCEWRSSALGLPGLHLGYLSRHLVVYSV